MSGFEPFALAAAGLETANTVAASKAKARQAETHAAFLGAQADYQRRLTDSREAALRRSQARQLGRMRALLADRGVDIGSGSPLLGQERAAADAEFDALTLRSAGAFDAWRLDNQAMLQRMEAADIRRRLPLTAGSSLFSGLRSAWSPGKKTIFDEWFPARTP